jgi:Protein of unknown function (DUF4065)
MALSFEFDFEVTKAALLYLASKELPNFDKYHAVKLLFLADREHLLRFGRPITGDDYSALPYGPTPNRILCFLDGLERVANEGADPSSDEVAELARCLAVKNLAHPTYHAVVQPDLDFLSRTDLIALDSAIIEHGRKSFEDLMDLTHGMKAYTASWQPDSHKKRFPMPFENFFADAPEKIDFLNELEEDQEILRKFSQPLEISKVMGA